MDRKTAPSENTRIVETFFPNGLKYTSAVFEKETLLELKKFFSNGTISQVIKYKNGKMISKESYTRTGELFECFNYYYDSSNEIVSITREFTNTIEELTFGREESSGRILKIRLKHNNEIIRKLDYFYTENGINCTDVDIEGSENYMLDLPPCADEKWFAQPRANSLVMRKLRMALAINV